MDEISVGEVAERVVRGDDDPVVASVDQGAGSHRRTRAGVEHAFLGGGVTDQGDDHVVEVERGGVDPRHHGAVVARGRGEVRDRRGPGVVVDVHRGGRRGHAVAGRVAPHDRHRPASSAGQVLQPGVVSRAGHHEGPGERARGRGEHPVAGRGVPWSPIPRRPRCPRWSSCELHRCGGQLVRVELPRHRGDDRAAPVAVVVPQVEHELVRGEGLRQCDGRRDRGGAHQRGRRDHRVGVGAHLGDRVGEVAQVRDRGPDEGDRHGRAGRRCHRDGCRVDRVGCPVAVGVGVGLSRGHLGDAAVDVGRRDTHLEVVPTRQLRPPVARGGRRQGRGGARGALGDVGQGDLEVLEARSGSAGGVQVASTR